MAPVILALRERSDVRCRVLVTAQHRELLDDVFACFGITPDRDLDVMQPAQSLAALTSRLIERLDAALGEELARAGGVDVVVAQGDTTTVFAAALAAFYRGIPFAHVEAGLRTGTLARPFPEEANRALVARLAAVHFAPTAGAAENLLREGVDPRAIHTVGNPVVDALQIARDGVAVGSMTDDLAPTAGRRLIYVTAHRRENFGAPLQRICTALRELAIRGDVELLYPVHPNPEVQRVVHAELADAPGIRLVEPLDYARSVAAMQAATLILTDSGGIQEEAPSLGVPVLVLRDATERPEGVAAGVAQLVGTDPAKITAAAGRLLDDPAVHRAMATAANPYGDGLAAGRIATILASGRPRDPAGRTG
ncbi:MAG: UDP-N-acetylglucosamine 2-epimerase (non-hydrolyzing) [bacterium]|nr:UDP-N-acetylglucosamine 2-epimerase (non-hydrolyzing) [bacterium]